MVQKELAIQSHQGAMLHSCGIPSRSGPSRQAAWACHNISLSLGCHLGSGMDILGISPLPISSLPSSSNVVCPRCQMYSVNFIYIFFMYKHSWRISSQYLLPLVVNVFLPYSTCPPWPGHTWAVYTSHLSLKLQGRTMFGLLPSHLLFRNLR